MGPLSYEDWAAAGGELGDTSEAAYYLYTQSAGAANGSAGAGASPSSANGLTLNLGTSTPYKLPAGIPAYSGYQAPNYAATTPNSTHWLNTMNAFAPTARSDMNRMLGFDGGNSNGYNGGYGQASTGYPQGIQAIPNAGIARPPSLSLTTPGRAPQSGMSPIAPQSTAWGGAVNDYASKIGGSYGIGGKTGTQSTSPYAGTDYWDQQYYNTFPEAVPYNNPNPTFADLYTGKTTIGQLQGLLGTQSANGGGLLK